MAIHQRSDVCAVPAAGVVAEAMVALVVADAVTEKFGGDSVAETRRNVVAYLDTIADHPDRSEPVDHRATTTQARRRSLGGPVTTGRARAAPAAVGAETAESRRDRSPADRGAGRPAGRRARRRSAVRWPG